MPSQEFTAFLQMMRRRPAPPREPSIAELRAGLEQTTTMLPVPPTVRCEPVDAGGVAAEWVSPPDADGGRTVLYLHGGGYVMGSIKSHRSLAAHIALEAKARVLLIDYRLAPEHVFPAALEDATATYRFLLAQGVEPRDIAVAGDSAGGGLTVATLVALRDAGDPLPAAAVCLSPWTDLEGHGESMTTRAAQDPMVQRDPMRRIAALYLGGKNPREPLAAPLHADLTGLPPLLIQVGTAEVLLDDSTRLAERARAAAVEVTLDVWDDMVHVFQIFAPFVPEAKQAVAQIGSFVRGHAG